MRTGLPVARCLLLSGRQSSPSRPAGQPAPSSSSKRLGAAPPGSDGSRALQVRGVLYFPKSNQRAGEESRCARHANRIVMGLAPPTAAASRHPQLLKRLEQIGRDLAEVGPRFRRAPEPGSGLAGPGVGCYAPAPWRISGSASALTARGQPRARRSAACPRSPRATRSNTSAPYATW